MFGSLMPSLSCVNNSNVGQPSADDSVVVKLLREAGGLPFVKTNVPQTLLSFECVNPGTAIDVASVQS